MEQQHTTLEAMTWNSQNPNVIIGGEADSTLAWNNFVADNVAEYQPIPANEPVPEGGLYGQVTYDDVVSYLNSFPTGYKFKPHDSELVHTYLAARIQGKQLPPNQIHEVKLYMFNPDYLAERYAPAGENEWYFFTSRDRKYKNGKRPNRAAGNGYWKATGADKAVILGDKKIGARKSLVYYKGKPLKGVKSDWIMHEFSFLEAPKVASGGHDMLFFDMSRHDAVTALDIYKRAGKQAESLSEFYENCKSLDIARTFQFPTLRQPPPSFLATMEEYIKEAPNFGSIPKRLEFQERDASPKKPEEPSEFIEEEEQVDEEEDNQKEAAESKEEAPESPPLIAVDDKADFLGLSEAADPRAAGLEECNALALEIAQPGNENASSSSGALTELGTTGWELSLATTPSNNVSHIGESKLGGGFDKLLLDSLYEDDAARRQIQYQNAGYGNDGGMDLHNPFEQQDPFMMSNSIAPPTNVQIAMTMQQQQQVQYQQMTMQQQHSQPLPMVPYGDQQPQYPYQQMQQPMSASNPFGDGFSSFPQNPAPQQGHNVLL